MTTSHNTESTLSDPAVNTPLVPAVRMHDIVKTFPGTKACNGATLEVAPARYIACSARTARARAP